MNAISPNNLAIVTHTDTAATIAKMGLSEAPGFKVVRSPELGAMGATVVTLLADAAGVFYEHHQGNGGASLYRVVSEPASEQQAVPVAQIDWRLIAKAAGEHGVRYRTNTALLAFLDAIEPARKADRFDPALPCKSGEGAGEEPFGYWVTQKGAEPALLRPPAYMPEASDLRTVTPLYTASCAVETDTPYRRLIDWIVEAQEMGQPVYISIAQDGAWQVGTEEKLRRRVADEATGALREALKPLATSVLSDPETASGWRVGYNISLEQQRAAHLAYFGEPTTLAALNARGGA